MEELQQIAARRYVSGYQIALVQTGLGDLDEAFASLDRACEERATELANLRIEPRFDPLRSDPRYAVLLERLGLDSIVS